MVKKINRKLLFVFELLVAVIFVLGDIRQKYKKIEHNKITEGRNILGQFQGVSVNPFHINPPS